MTVLSIAFSVEVEVPAGVNPAEHLSTVQTIVRSELSGLNASVSIDDWDTRDGD